ncbi:MAG TPA: TylF/MycF family methyltransferase [Stellaceae bacterium]|jgi:O-methyltransferase/8-demethyl-8-(2,3-dimethoxy-alpha-L-rhamnosyl)tetracenomycin-C 4'-O-methyltransferase
MPLTRNIARRLAYRIPPLRRLAEERAALSQAVAGLEAEREALQTLVTAVEGEREHLVTELHRLSVQRDVLTQTVVGLQTEQVHSRAYDSILKNLADIAEILRVRLGPQIAAVLDGQEIATGRILRGLEQGKARQGSNGIFGAQRYLDLLELTLTGMIYGDQATDPGSKGSYDPSIRAVGRDWPSQAHTMIGLARLRNLRALCERALAEGTPGDFIETGVWRGGACILMRGILQVYGDAARRVFVADSFCGLPPPNPSEYAADEDDPHHTYAQLAVSRQQVEDNFRRYGLLDDRVVFLEGWFKDTLPAAPIERLAVLRLDGDMYESTIQALDALYHKVSPGGFVIIDDYLLTPCAKAVDHFRAARGVTAPLNNIDDAAVWWQAAQ